MDQIESLEFRTKARKNGYEYGPFFLYKETLDTILDSHVFPNFVLSDEGSSIEKLMSLQVNMLQNLDKVDSNQKLPRNIPGVRWENDNLVWTLDLSGEMYITDYADYNKTTHAIREAIVAQGWKINIGTDMGTLTYNPNLNDSDSLYNEDPVDAAGRAMIMSSASRLNDQMVMLGARIRSDTRTYAKYAVRNALSGSGPKDATSGFGNFFGPISTIEAGGKAFSANTNASMALKWNSVGYPICLKIEGQIQITGLYAIMTSLSLVPRAYVVDDTSGGRLYPTRLDIRLGIKNLYGHLYTTSDKNVTGIKNK